MVDKKQSGFALLMSLIVVSAILSVGLVILDLSIKQVRLAATTKDSEIAFHAANAGMECARYWRREASSTLAVGTPTLVDCFGDSETLVDGGVSYGANTDGSAYSYRYEFTWGGADAERCTQISKVMVISDISGSGVQVDNMRTLIPGYPDGNILNCGVAGECTVISVQGYNRSCAQRGSFGTIQREVLLEF